jgi:hypothetical protein
MLSAAWSIWSGKDPVARSSQLPPARIVIAAPGIAVNVIMETVDCVGMNILARRARGKVSVGLKAKLVVNAR